MQPPQGEFVPVLLHASEILDRLVVRAKRINGAGIAADQGPGALDRQLKTAECHR